LGREKVIPKVAMKKLGAEVYGRSVSLLRTYIEKETTTMTKVFFSLFGLLLIFFKGE